MSCSQSSGVLSRYGVDELHTMPQSEINTLSEYELRDAIAALTDELKRNDKFELVAASIENALVTFKTRLGVVVRGL